MQNNILFLIIVFLITGCNQNTSTKDNIKDTVYINDYNVLFVPDLSNRINPNIHPKPVNDTLMLSNILDNLITLIDLKNRKTNQSDIYKFDFINKNILNNNNVCSPNELEINLSRFQGNLVGASNYLRDSIDNDINLFKKNVKNIYDYSLNNIAGADLWNYFNETMHNSLINKPAINITSDERTEDEPLLFKRVKNVVVLFT